MEIHIGIISKDNHAEATLKNCVDETLFYRKMDQLIENLKNDQLTSSQLTNFDKEMGRVISATSS